MEVFDFKIARIYCEPKERLVLEKVFKLFQNNIEQVFSNLENYKKVTITTFPLKDQNMISIKANNPANIYEQILIFFLKRNILNGYYNLIPKLVEYIKSDFHPINYEEFIYFYQETALKCFEEKEKYMPTIVFTYLNYHYQENLWKVLQRNITTWSKIKFDVCSFFDNRFNTHFVLDSDEKIVDFISKNIDYGWLDKDGNKYDNFHEWREKYIIYPIEIMFQNKLGCCIDKSRMTSFLLSKIGCSNMIIFEKRTTEGKELYHAF